MRTANVIRRETPVSFVVPAICTALAGAITALIVCDIAGKDLSTPIMFFMVGVQAVLLFWMAKCFWWADHRDLFQPLIFLGFTCVLPMNIVKGIYVALDGHSFAGRLLGSDLHLYFAEALAAACLGIGSMTLGYMLPIGSQMARKLPFLSIPAINEKSVSAQVGVMLLMFAGVCVNLQLIALGRFGSSLGKFNESQMTLISVLLSFSPYFIMGLFLACFYHRYWARSPLWKVYMAGLVAICVVFAMLSGSRSMLVTYYLAAMAGLCYSRFQDIAPRYIAKLLAYGGVTLVAGTLIGSTFRDLRKDYSYEAQLSLEETWGVASQSATQVGQQDMEENARDFLDRFVERLCDMDLLAVTLARADELKAAERAMEMDNNIIRETVLAFIPRPLWPNKPRVTDFGLKFTELYLESPKSSNGPTIFGDLYRNFGWTGVPVGMALLGIFLRLIYTRYVLMAEGNGLSCLFYYSLLGTVGYEAYYSSYISGTIRVAFSFIFLILLFRLLPGPTLKEKEVVG